MHDISIRKVNNGFIASRTPAPGGFYHEDAPYVFTDPKALGDWIVAYYGPPPTSEAPAVAAPSSIAAGCNPDKLTEKQVGVKDGWRLLTKEEHAPEREVKDTEWWNGREWLNRGSTWNTLDGALRTKNPPGFYLPKPTPVTHIFGVENPHNPGGFTPGEVGVSEGWRLLSVEEVNSQPEDNPDNNPSPGLQNRGATWGWEYNERDCAWNRECTYRTKQTVNFFLRK